MIVAMKKIYIIVQDKDAKNAVESLRPMAVVHLQPQQAPESVDLRGLQDDLNLVNAALDVLSGNNSGQIISGNVADTQLDWKLLSRQIIDLDKRQDQLNEYSRLLKIQITQWQSWGDFDPHRAIELEQKGVFSGLYSIPRIELPNLGPDIIVKVVSSAGPIAHCLVLSRDKIELAYPQVAWPKMGLSQMRQRLIEDSRIIDSLKHQLRLYLRYRSQLMVVQSELRKQIEFYQAYYGMGKQEGLSYLVGYCPQDKLTALSEHACKQSWAFMSVDPGADDDVPVLLQTPAWAKLIKPVFGLLGIVPGYRELDVSIVFLVFLSIFFGILIGDAGYGVVYLFLAVWFKRKINPTAQSLRAFYLFYVLSSCAIIWGVLTGTFFGQEWLLKTGYKPLVPALNDPKIMQSFCFFLGALHLSLAHGWRTIIKLPSWSALSEIGWICILWTAFFLARTLILSEPLPFWVMKIAAAGISLVILFTNPQRNILKAVGEGLGAVALSLMNNFTDVVSYVRLFAVGLAGVAIAETTNAMSSSLGSGIIAVIAGFLIVVVGHGLNIVLGPMSVLVHGIRLNVLEFSGHAGVTWSGIEYKPFK